jgi:hypothetical protein
VTPAGAAATESFIEPRSLASALRAGLVALLVVAVLLAAVALVAFRPPAPGTAQSTTAPPPTTSTAGSAQEAPAPLRGLSFSPRNTSAAGLADYFAKAAAGGLVEWVGDWAGLAGPSSSPAAIATLSAQHGLEFAVAVQFFSQSDGSLLRPLNSTNEAAYLSSASEFAADYKPFFFGVGVEVNILYEKNSTAFRQFVQFYAEAYDAIKAASPATEVSTIFQLEHMEGLRGGLLGGTDNASLAEWGLLASFTQDVFAFTTYPGLVFHSPSELPAEYYVAAEAHSGLPLAVTEAGWQSANVSSDWASSEAAQSSFASTFLTQTASAPTSFTVWSFLYDPPAQVPFDSMGLFSSAGVAKQAWAVWSSG